MMDVSVEPRNEMEIVDFIKEIKHMMGQEMGFRVTDITFKERMAFEINYMNAKKSTYI